LIPDFSADVSSSPLSARILKGGAAVFTVLGAGLVAWLARQWIAHPEIQASQLGNTAPYWPAAILFVVFSTIAGVALLWRASRRIERGEDLFAQRHRKSLKDVEDEDAS